MFKRMSLRRGFTLVLVIVYLLSLPVVVGVTYKLLLKNAEKESLERAELMLTAIRAMRQYAGGVMRPVAEDLAEDRVIPELMSGFYVVRETAQIISDEEENFSFKFAVLNPMNPDNLADDFERAKIQAYREGKLKGRWTGFLKTPEGNRYAVMTPIKVSSERCLECHGDPADAPEDIIKLYGDKNGFGWEVGETIGVEAIYVPADVPVKNAQRSLFTFTGIYSGLFLLVIIIIDRLIKASIIRPIEHIVETADDISRGHLDRDFEIDAENEIKTLADAFRRMKVSLQKAMEMLRK